MNTPAERDTHMPFLQALAAVAARLREAGSLDEVMLDPAGTVTGLFACDRFTLYAVDAEGDYLVSKVKTAAGAWRDVKVAIAPHAIAGHVALARRAVSIADAYDDAELARIAPGLRFPRGVDQRTGYRTRQVLAVPVTAPGPSAQSSKVLGVIQLVNTHDGQPFAAHALAGAEALATSLATSLSEALATSPARSLAAARGDARPASRSAPTPAPAGQAPAAPAAPAAATIVGEPVASRAVVPAQPGDEGARLLARIVADAHRLGAAAIHIEAAGSAGSTIRLRRDGALVPYASLPPGRAEALMRRLEAGGALGNGAAGHGPLHGTLHGTLRGGAHGMPDVMLQATALPTRAGMDVVLRFAAADAAVPLAQLGMAPDDLARLRRLLDEARGLLLVCGPGDAGKSTTLHALLACLNRPERKICTAEDPVKPAGPGLRQVHAGRAAELEVAAALEAFRRADADVIMIDAACDRTAAGLAIEAALTGRLVLAALPARSAADGARQLLDMAAEPFGAAAALAGALAQRLAAKLCTACRQPYRPGAAELELLLTEFCAELQPDDDAPDTARVAAYVAANNAANHATHHGNWTREHVLASWRERHADAGGHFTLYRAVGCAECHRGYRGRVALFELMTVGEHAARLLARRPASAQLAMAALGDGMRTLKMDGIDKVLAGITDIGMVRAACAR
ncbi:ATPase, T2SS/T4P/T4SS family [Pseudoduganella umbonata]|uniref:GAF domain-containing protein n=1 Tax=Pseudoduganella umbonata TaxID=864828 RepID=A0A4P8HS74_9BURK|nr:ATPase, T2SS/T4P/T4SS family [Pseudoduganella umbonata]MBB3224375.1 type II secretory ATPase GspE/PulE/Tfp pilus assembly ATPase PilB-like protein [Pseudoduganella umbonata]QCP11255.1 GAF domain-containing protein [Pseudoduganella umbonata]